jgi:hypothetical protein
MRHGTTLLFAGACALELGCSSTFGASGSRIVHHGDATNLGFKAGSLVDVALLDSDLNPALGIETTLLERVDEGGNEWGQWRALALLGVTHMPRQEEGALGYELFLTPGLARYAADESRGERNNMVFALGAQGGLPIRLSGGLPPWKADDIVGLAGYLVPSIGGTWLGFDAFEVTASLSLRVQLWSAATP